MKRLEAAPEHEFEAEHGLPEALPRNERLLWQGAPDWRLLARDALHVRGIAAYFGVLLAWRGANVLGHGGSVADAALAVAWLLPLAAIGLALLAGFAFLAARTTVYTVTDRRVVMRIGIVLTITFNLPYARIDAAASRARPDGSGDVTLLLDAGDHLAYLHLWPHARPWQMRRPQPMLRGLRDARLVAGVLSAALAESVAGSLEVSRPRPVAVPVGVSGAVSVPALEPQPLPSRHDQPVAA